MKPTFLLIACLLAYVLMVTPTEGKPREKEQETRHHEDEGESEVETEGEHSGSGSGKYERTLTYVFAKTIVRRLVTRESDQTTCKNCSYNISTDQFQSSLRFI